MGMKKWLKICVEDGALAGWLCLLVSIVLMVSGFCLPPLAVIDSSVIIGVGELMGFAVIFKLPNMIQSIKDGKELKIKHNETEVEIKSKPSEE